MHDQKRFGFTYLDGASLKKLSEEKEQLSLGLAFRFDREAGNTLTRKFHNTANRKAA